MKFGAYQQQIAPGVMKPPALKAPTDINAYGEGEGEGYGALAAALGQVTKVALQQRDDEDAAALTEARNEIMTSLTQQLYGKDGLFETGVGKNAEGLTGRVVDAVRKTTDSVAQRLNGRVAYALKGNLSENLQNFQRIAASKELGEKMHTEEGNFQSALANNAALAGLNYDNAEMVASQMRQNEQFIAAWGMRQGLTGEQIEALRRDSTTKTAMAAANAALQADDTQTAHAILQTYREGMDPTSYWSIEGKIQSKEAQNTMATDVRSVMERHKIQNADGSVTYDMTAVIKEIQSGKKKVKHHGKGGAGGSYSGDATMDKEIADAAAEFGVDPKLVAACAQVESSYSQDSVSDAGAVGVMQLMPDTAEALGVNARDRRDNIRGGAKYLRQLLDMFDGNVDLAVAAYNAGPQAVKDYGGIPPYAETQNHVKKVKEAYGALGQQGGGIDMSRTYYDVKPGKAGEVEGLTNSTWTKLNTLAALYAQQFGGEEDYEPFYVTAGHAEGGHSEDSDHYKGLAFDIAMDSLKRHPERLQWLQETAPKVGLTPLNEYEGYGYTGFKTGDNFHFSDNGGEISIGGGGGDWEEEVPYTQDEIDARVKYAWALYGEQDKLNNINQKQAYEGIVGQVDAAGSYADAALIIQGSSLPLDLKERALGLARSKFGITKAQADGRSGSGGRGGKPYDPSKDIQTIRKFAAKLKAGEKISSANLVDTREAKKRLQANGVLDGIEDMDLEDDAYAMSALTKDIEKHGIQGAYSNYVADGTDELVAACLISTVDPYYLRSDSAPEETETEEDTEEDPYMRPD